MSRPPRYFSTRNMTYGAEQVEAGEIMQLRGHMNDAVLLRVGYIAKAADHYPVVEIAQCVRCGKEFVDSSFKAVHDARCGQLELDIGAIPGGNIISSADPALVGEAVDD